MQTPSTIAVIDLGTNTFHAIIIEIINPYEFRVLDKYREPVKLAEGGVGQNQIMPPAFARGLTALEKIKSIIDSKKVNTIVAFATSAIRSAANGKDFIEKAFAQTGIQIQIINGNEEAALIFKGIQYGLSLPIHEDVLVMDIGGGSVEFIVGNRQNAKFLRSIDLGAARILERIGSFDKISEEQLNQLNDILANELDSLLREIKEFNIKTLIGSSGTFETLGILATHESNEKNILDNLNGYTFDGKKFKKIYKKIILSTRTERSALPGMEPLRVDMIAIGAALTNHVVERLDIERIRVSTYALKEGIIVDLLNEIANDEREMGIGREPREQMVVQFAQKFGCSIEKGDYVGSLALSIFDQTQMLHNFGLEEREILYFATMLVDIGHYIQRSGHHKHGQYIIQNSSLPGFTGKELLLIANIVRYHRKSLPSIEHLHYNVLYKEDKNIVNKLGGILRLAVNLNRANRKAVKSVSLYLNNPNREITMLVCGNQNIDLELEAANDSKEMFEKAFELKLIIEKAR